MPGSETSVLSHVAVCLSVFKLATDELERDTRGAQWRSPESPCSAQASHQSSGNAMLQAKSTWPASEHKYLRRSRCHWQSITGSHVQNKNLGGGDEAWVLKMYRTVFIHRPSQCPSTPTQIYSADFKLGTKFCSESGFLNIYFILKRYKGLEKCNFYSNDFFFFFKSFKPEDETERERAEIKHKPASDKSNR